MVGVVILQASFVLKWCNSGFDDGAELALCYVLGICVDVVVIVYSVLLSCLLYLKYKNTEIHIQQ